MKFRLALVIVLFGTLVACGSSSTSAPSPTPSSGSGVAASIVSGASTMTTTAYAPNPISASVGGSVPWTYNDATTYTSVANGGAWNSVSIAPGGKLTMTFSSAGTFPDHCSLHPGMVGTVTVQ